MHKICFTISFISCLYMFRAHVLIIRRSKLHYTVSGIITLVGGRLVHEAGIEFCRRLRLLDLKTIDTRRWHPLSPRKYSWYTFLSRRQGHSSARKIMSTKNSDTIGNRTRDLPNNSTLPQPNEICI